MMAKQLTQNPERSHLPDRLSSMHRTMIHGVDILIWKIAKKIKHKFFG